MKRVKYSDGHRLVWSDEFHGWVTSWTKKPKRDLIFDCERCGKENSNRYEDEWCDECVEKYEEEFGPLDYDPMDAHYERVRLRYP